MEVGQRIKDTRQEQGVQVTALAYRCGVSPATIYRIESGDRAPSMSLLEKIAHELRTEPAEFLREPAPPKAPAPSSGQPETERAGAPRVSLDRLAEHFEDVRGGEVDYLNSMLSEFWRLALPDEKPQAHFVPEDIDDQRIWSMVQHVLGAGNVFEPQQVERIRRGALKQATLAR